MAKNAVILLNMGGPNDLYEVQTFLHNMFNDPNILTMKSGLLRRFIASVITSNRTKSAQEVYQKLGGKSPIAGITKKLVAALQAKLGEEVIVDFAMRYTPPFADVSIARLKAAGVTHVYLIPLYPQYSTTTTKSSLEDYEARMHALGFKALVTEIKHFYANAAYNAVIIDRIREAMAGADAGAFELIFSAHGLPQKIVDKGDPYEHHVTEHVALLKPMLEAAGLAFADIHIAYQSKVGPMKWLEPSLEQKLESLERKKVLVFPIAFTIDNSETLYELDMEYREVAEELGFEDYRVAACPNDHPLFVEALVSLYGKMRA
ncbi:ferrochelatase [Sulfurimonas sp. HSL1-6]|uniref:ferrochelatase n=1 Tax=Thiomicrolovo immobilis TaxID=3131935 RepID=UPI0031F914A9